MNVESILERKGTEVATIAPEASIKRAADWLRAKNAGALVVTSNDAILGIISERDIVRAFSQYGEPVASMQVKDIMTHGLITASPEDDLTHLMRLMTRHRVRHMPVLRNGKLAGIIRRVRSSPRDAVIKPCVMMSFTCIEATGSPY